MKNSLYFSFLGYFKYTVLPHSQIFLKTNYSLQNIFYICNYKIASVQLHSLLSHSNILYPLIYQGTIQQYNSLLTMNPLIVL